MTRRTIGIDGCNLALPNGTGIATYGYVPPFAPLESRLGPAHLTGRIVALIRSCTLNAVRVAIATLRH